MRIDSIDDVAAVLRLKVKQRNMTLRALARRVGCSATTVSNATRGANITLAGFIELMNALEMRVTVVEAD